LNKLKLENTVGPNRSAVVSATPPNPTLCFDFVFPITFSYNNGTAITATSLDGLLDILNNESPTLFLEGVVFPFQVQYGGAVHTINNEAELFSLIIQCGLPTFNDDLQHSYCFDIVFPINVASAGQVITIGSQQELDTYLSNPNNTEANIIFPISIIDDNQTRVLNNVYEFYDIVNSCGENDCICTLEYAPVCVQTPNNGVIQFGNLCFAICAGYSQNDLVSCDPESTCEISNLWVQTGACNSDQTYSLTLSFTYANTTATTFEVRNSSNILVGTYNLTDMPLTISHYENPANTPDDELHINLASNCTASVTWTKPVCNPTTTHTFGQLLGSCFTIAYPVDVQYQGAIRRVFSDGELLQYWNPTFTQMPVMNYPIVVTFGNSTYTFANQAAFENQIHISCP